MLELIDSKRSQDDDDEDEKYAEEQDGWEGEGNGLARDNSTDYILTAKQQNELANAAGYNWIEPN